MPHNILFVCHGNMLRSPYAADWFNRYCAENKIRGKALSAGLSVNPGETYKGRTLVQVSTELCDWSSRVAVMDEENELRMRLLFKTHKRLQDMVVLGIPDRFWPDAYGIKGCESWGIDRVRKYVATHRFGPALMDRLLEDKLEFLIGKRPERMRKY